MANFYHKDDPDISKKVGAKLLSEGYRSWLGRMVPKEIQEQFGLPEAATWADAIALQTVKRAVALVSKEQVCFTAITELRESTEGKTPERVMVAQNTELMALAAAINQAPAPEPEQEEERPNLENPDEA